MNPLPAEPVPMDVDRELPAWRRAIQTRRFQALQLRAAQASMGTHSNDSLRMIRNAVEIIVDLLNELLIEERLHVCTSCGGSL